MCPQISAKELACEEAKAKLARCCPGFDNTPIECVDTSGEVMGCDQVDLRLDDARCVTDRSCQALVAEGVCARAIANWNGGFPQGFTAVCAAP